MSNNLEESNNIYADWQHQTKQSWCIGGQSMSYGIINNAGRNFLWKNLGSPKSRLYSKPIKMHSN